MLSTVAKSGSTDVNTWATLSVNAEIQNELGRGNFDPMIEGARD
jgi:hypothetical protein